MFGLVVACELRFFWRGSLFEFDEEMTVDQVQKTGPTLGMVSDGMLVLAFPRRGFSC